jgi:hypothetical protein
MQQRQLIIRNASDVRHKVLQDMLMTMNYGTPKLQLNVSCRIVNERPLHDGCVIAACRHQEPVVNSNEGDSCYVTGTDFVLVVFGLSK